MTSALKSVFDIVALDIPVDNKKDGWKITGAIYKKGAESPLVGVQFSREGNEPGYVESRLNLKDHTFADPVPMQYNRGRNIEISQMVAKAIGRNF
jgi:hypothetical protein